MPPSTDASAGPFDAWRLADRVCVVTGGASGIGLATARAFALAGGRVQLLDRNEAAGKTAVQAMADEGLKARFEAIDVTREADVDTAFERIASQEGRIDVLVNSAGIAIRRPAVDLKLSDWNAVIDVNLTGVFLCSRAAARHMIPRASGAIVSLSSIMGLSGGGIYPNVSYQSSKGALVNLTRALAVEWAPHNIRVNAVAPTWVRTDFVKVLIEDPSTLARMQEMTPLGRIAETDDVVGAILFLSSGAAAMITGHTLPVDGGFLAQ